MVEWLIEPLRYGFILRGLIAGILAGAAALGVAAHAAASVISHTRDSNKGGVSHD